MIWPFMRLVDVNESDGRIEIEAELLGTTDELDRSRENCR